MILDNKHILWLRGLSQRGGKGVVDNIDARGLGRVANEIEQLHEAVDQETTKRKMAEKRIEELERLMGLDHSGR